MSEANRFWGQAPRWSILPLCAVAAIPSYGFAQELAASGEQDDTVYLGEIIVSATGYEQNVADAPASVTVIDAETLEAGAFTSLTDALASVPGLNVGGAPNETDIQIRGMPGDYTLILVDGRRQSTRDARTNGTKGIEQSYIPPISAIERIEIVRGAQSTLYGSDAMGGIINVITKPVPEEWTTSVKVETTLQEDSNYGNSGQVGFYTAGPLLDDRLGAQLWGRYYTRGEDSYLGGVMGLKEGSLAGRLTFAPTDNQEFAAEAGVERLRHGATEGQSDDRNRYRYHDRVHWALSHEGDWDRFSSEVSLYQEIATRRTFDFDTGTNAYVEDPRSPKITNTTLDAKLSGGSQWLGDHFTVLGLQWRGQKLVDHNPGLRDEADRNYSVSQTSIYLEDEWDLSNSFTLTTGLRAEKHSEYDLALSPRIYGVWNANPNLTVKGGISTGFKAPDIREIAPGYASTTGGRNCVYGGANPTCAVKIGDPNLKAETSTNFEVGFDYNNLNNFHASATFFRSELRNRIQDAKAYDGNGDPIRWADDPNYLVYYNYNVGRARIQGVELTADYSFTSELDLQATYTFTDSEQLTGDYAGTPLARTPKNSASLRLNWAPEAAPRFSSFIQATYHGEEIEAGLRVDDNGSPINIGGVDARLYDAYTLVDVGVGYDITDSVKLNAVIYNVADKRVDVAGYNSAQEGRRLWVGLGMQF